jgi:hypothetical protein
MDVTALLLDEEELEPNDERWPMGRIPVFEYLAVFQI